jgi:hypothetical protein
VIRRPLSLPRGRGNDVGKPRVSLKGLSKLKKKYLSLAIPMQQAERMLREAMTSLLSQVEVCPDCGLITEDSPNEIRVFIELDEKGRCDIAFECTNCGFVWYLCHQQEVWDGTFDPLDDDDGGDEGDCDEDC